MEEPTRGMVVMGPDGQLGTVDEVIYETHGSPARVLVRRPNGQEMILQPGTFFIERGTVRLTGGSGLADTMRTGFETQRIDTSELEGVGQATTFGSQQIGAVGSVETLDVQPGMATVIPVIREEVAVSRRQVERGGVRVHKRVAEREEVVEQPTFREEVHVERVPIGVPVAQEVGPRREGDTLIIPVLEEVLVVEKRLVVKEEIRITTRRVQETEQARVLLREEHIELENIDDPTSMA